MWVTATHRLLGACTSNDCGSYEVTLNWQIPFAGVTGYYITCNTSPTQTNCNGGQVADTPSSPYTLTGLDCGTAFTLTVQPHTGSGGTGSTYTQTYTTPNCPGPFPLKVSSNGRYLETQSGAPWLMVGDSPQSNLGNLSVASSDTYFADRAAHGFNTVWANLLCEAYTACAANGDTYDGVAPFTVGTDPPSYLIGSGMCGNCNSTYFSRMHQMIADAQSDGIAVMLDPMETGNCLTSPETFWQTMTNSSNGDGTVSTTDGDYRYGEYLGTEFGDLKNIIWLSGNDFSCYTTAADDNDAISIANGIKATDPSALQTLEIGIGSGYNNSTDDWSNWSNTLQLNGSYTYDATYGGVRNAYDQTSSPSPLPVFMEESNYEGQQNSGTDGCLTTTAGERHCREQEWWTMTSGATGQMYGGNYSTANGPDGDAGSYGIAQGFTDANIDTTGVTQLGYVTSFMDQINWWQLVPDGLDDGSGRTYVTAGGGTCSGYLFTTFNSNTCITDATIPTGVGSQINTLVAYYPDPSAYGTITVDMSKFSGSVTAQWYDPTNGQYSTVSGSPFTNTGTQTFAPSTTNNAGLKDWVLLLQS